MHKSRHVSFKSLIYTHSLPDMVKIIDWILTGFSSELSSVWFVFNQQTSFVLTFQLKDMHRIQLDLERKSMLWEYGRWNIFALKLVSIFKSDLVNRIKRRGFFLLRTLFFQASGKANRKRQEIRFCFIFHISILGNHSVMERAKLLYELNTKAVAVK